MPIQSVKSDIVNKSYTPTYIFSGQEYGIMDIYIDKLAMLHNTSPRRVDSVAEAFSKMQTRAFTKETYCYVVRDDKDFMKDDKVWARIMSGRNFNGNRLIIIITKIDQRTKFYKAYKEQITEFEKLGDSILCKYIQKKIPLTDREAYKLCRYSNNDYARAMLECDKIQQLANARQINVNEAFKAGMDEKLIWRPPNDAIFDLVDAICMGKVIAFDLLMDCKAIGEPPLVIIQVLYNNMRSMLVVMADGGGAGITERTGLNSFQVKLAKEKLRGNYYTLDDLLYNITLIRFIEKSIKIGKIDPEIAVDYLITALL